MRWRFGARGWCRPRIGWCPRGSGCWRHDWPTALLSVSQKTGLAAFARGLPRLGYELFATGSTLQALEGAAVDARPVSELTGFPEMMDGRIKTLHPGVHAGILARRDKPDHLQSLADHGLREIDLVCCNLYPFVATVLQRDVTFEQAVEQIDIGGPPPIPPAAQNPQTALPVARPPRRLATLVPRDRRATAP